MKKYLRFLFGVIKFLKGRIDPHQAFENAKNILRKRILHREENFLNLIEKGIFGYSKSPYQKLFLKEFKKNILTQLFQKKQLKLLLEFLQW